MKTKIKPGWSRTSLGVTNIPWDENHEPTQPDITENMKDYPLVAQVFPRYEFEKWDDLHLCPIRTPEWVARVFRLERDPDKTYKPDSLDCSSLVRVLLAVNDTYRSEEGARRGAMKLLRDVRNIWPLVERRRKKGKPLKFVPILGKARDDPKGPEVPVSDLARIVTV